MMKQTFQKVSILLLLIQSGYTASLCYEAIRGHDGSLLLFLGAAGYAVIGLPVGIYWIIQTVRATVARESLQVILGLLLIGLVGVLTFPICMALFTYA